MKVRGVLDKEISRTEAAHVMGTLQVNKDKHERCLGAGMTVRQGLQGRNKELGKRTGFCGGEGKLCSRLLNLRHWEEFQVKMTSGQSETWE